MREGRVGSLSRGAAELAEDRPDCGFRELRGSDGGSGRAENRRVEGLRQFSFTVAQRVRAGPVVIPAVLLRQVQTE